MAERTIFLKNERGLLRQEGIAGAAIVPGMLVQLSTDGEYDPHATAGGAALPEFAFEKELWDGTDVDTPYAAGDRLLTGVCSAGVEVYALLAAGAAAVTRGAYLQSAGDGTLEVVAAGTPGTDYPGNAIARAQEAVDNSGGATTARIIVMVL